MSYNKTINELRARAEADAKGYNATIDALNLDIRVLLGQLETARKALERRGCIWTIKADNCDCYVCKALANLGAERPPVQTCGHEWQHCHIGTCLKCGKQLSKREKK